LPHSILNISRSEISDHDWKELTWLLRHEHSDIYNIVLVLLKAKLQERVIPEIVLIGDGDDEAVENTVPEEKETKDDEDEDSAI
jgi:hypothetical protein